MTRTVGRAGDSDSGRRDNADSPDPVVNRIRSRVTVTPSPSQLLAVTANFDRHNKTRVTDSVPVRKP